MRPQSAESSVYEEFQGDNEFRYDLAKSLIRDARFTRIHIANKRDPASLKIYELYYNFWLQGGYYVCLWVNLALIFFEEPPSFVDYIGIIPYYIVALVNITCILYFLSRWLHQMKCSKFTEFWNNKYNIATISIISLMILDLGIFMIMRSVVPKTPRFQWSRFLRPLLCATFPENHKIRSALNNLKGTLHDILIIFGLFVFMLGFFSLIALQFLASNNLFYPNGSPYFRNYLDVIFDLYVLVTTSNSPDVIIPAYEKSSLYSLLYLLVTVVCNWIFMGITIASVYNAYKIHLGRGVINNVRQKKHRLKEAFYLLRNSDTGEMEISSFCAVMKKVDPSSTESKNILLFKLLDINKSNSLSIGQFTKLTEYMHLNFEEITMNYSFFYKKIPSFYWCYMSALNQKIKPIIRSKYTRLFFEGVVLLNAILMIIFNDTEWELTFEWIFTMVFSFELLIRIFASGVNLYFDEMWNVFDFVVIVLALISLMVQQIITYLHMHLSNHYLKFLLALRVLRLLKILTVVRSFRIIIQSIFILLPSLLAYTAVQLSIYYIYICVGMEAFGNRYFPPNDNIYEMRNSTDTVDCGDPRLKNTDFTRSHYCILGFNSASDGFFLMTILTVSNNWHILLLGPVLTTHKAAKLFFISIHLFCVILVMNIVLAFIIDAYLMEVESNKGHFENVIEERLVEIGLSAKVELVKRNLQGYGTINFDLSKEMLKKAFPNLGESGSVCFRLNESTPKDMETLLQRMFEDDIQKLHNEFFTYDLKQDDLDRVTPTELSVKSDNENETQIKTTV